MTAAAALGGTLAEADLFGVRVDKCLQEVQAKTAAALTNKKAPPS
jgi:hypothetical protein